MYRPGGRIAIAIWDAPERCETEVLFRRLRSLAPAPPGTPTPLGCSDPGVVESLLEEAGLTVVDQGEATYHLTFRDLDHAVTTHPSAGPSKR